MLFFTFKGFQNADLKRFLGCAVGLMLHLLPVVRM